MAKQNDPEKPIQAERENEIIVDEQTGVRYQRETETWVDRVCAWISLAYLLAVLLALSWELLRVWVGQGPRIPFVRELVDEQNIGRLGSPLFRLMAYTAIGGGLGGVATGIRSIITWHLEREAFGARFLWKYITLPPLGSLLAVMVYAIIRGGVASLAGAGTASDNATTQALWAFAIGALVGFGSHKVLIWVDEQITKLFKTSQVVVPNVKGKSKTDAETVLTKAGFVLGNDTETLIEETENVDKVISQNPSPGSPLAAGMAVDVAMGIEGISVPDLTGMTEDESRSALVARKLVLGKIDRKGNDGGLGRVVDQVPVARSLIARKSAVGITISAAGS